MTLCFSALIAFDRHMTLYMYMYMRGVPTQALNLHCKLVMVNSTDSSYMYETSSGHLW